MSSLEEVNKKFPLKTTLTQQYTNETDRQTDGRTDRETDRQTDRRPEETRMMELPGTESRLTIYLVI